MRASLIVSLAFHGLLLAMALTGFRTQNKLDQPRPVQVEIISPGEFGGVKAGKPDQNPEAEAKPVPAAEKRPEIVPAAADLRATEGTAKKLAALPPPKPVAPPPAEPQKPAESKPEPPPEEKAAAAPVSAPAKRADAQRDETQKRKERHAKPERTKQEPKRRPPPKDDRIAALLEKPPRAERGESDFDPKRIAALLNRDPTAGDRAQEEGPRRPWRQPSTLEEQMSGAVRDAPRREAYGAPDGRDERMGADDIAAFRGQISRCWSPPVGGLGGDAIIVKLRIMLNQDGTVTRPPELTNDSSSPFFRPAADSAIRAVLQCQPYRMPPDKYGQWRDMLLTFDPSQMFGG